jgi:hypothetical protein
MVDVTIGGDKVKVESWKYLKVEPLSDHPYIQFQFVLENNLTKAPSRKRVPKLTNLDKKVFQERLNNKVTKLKNNVNWSTVVTSRDLDHIITDITHIIAESAMQSLLQKEKKRSNLEFWTPELTTLRTQMRKDKNIKDNLRKVCEDRGNNGKQPHSEMAIEETNYIKSKAKYQKHLRLSKNKSFKTFCSTNMNKDLFNSLKTLTKRQVGGELPSELLVGNKTITDEVMILKELSKSFFPEQRKIGPVQEEIINNY